MLRIQFGSFTAIFLFLTRFEVESSHVAESHDFGSSITDFSLDLLRNLHENQTEDNSLISPTSIFRVMLLTYFGSEGLTRLLMEVAMKLDMNYTEAVNQYELWRNQTVDGVQEGDRIYFDSKIQLKPNITALLGEDISQIDFCKSSSVGVVNDWVAKTTRGEIKDFIDELRKDTIMMLISVIYMKKSWKFAMDKRKTRIRFFFLSRGEVKFINMMYLKRKLDYHDSAPLKSEILSIPYDGNRLSFVIFLPHRNTMNVGELINSLNYTIIRTELAEMLKQTVTLHLPKFKVEAEVDMKPLFERLGLSILFSPSTANLSGFTDHQLYVNEVLQKVKIKVNEEGTTAAASSAVSIVGRSSFSRRITFNVDRPFVYMVYDRVAQVPLFLGTMMNPEYSAEVEVVHEFGPSITDFSLEAFRALLVSSTDDNLVMSPSNIFRVLLLTYFGSAGRTSSVMRRVMRLNKNFTETVVQYNIWRNQIFQGVKEADRIFIDTDFHLRDRIKALLGEDISQLNFSDTSSVEVINDWVEEKTGGEITDFIEEVDSATKMLLTSVIYMQEAWLSAFDKNDTETMNFTLSNGTTREVRMMVKKGESFKHHKSETLRSDILSIPYEDERLSFIVFLPDQSDLTTVKDVIGCMNHTNIKEELKARYRVYVSLYLPKFEVQGDLDYGPVLDKMGLSEIFYAGIANFDNFTSDPTLHVSKVFQKVVIKVDERGTTASAASGVQIARYGGSGPGEFKLDRPFVYMVYDELAELPLFLGTMVDPTRRE